MWKNYFKVALRNLYRFKGFSFINIFGLAIGITGCLCIGLFVWDEMQYDKFVKDGDQIYRIYLKSTNSSGTTTSATSPPVYATYLQDNFPEVKNTARMLMWSGKMLIETEDKSAYEEKGAIADSSFFSFFPLTFTKGSAESVFSEKMSVVITEDLAHKYFGVDDPIGKTVKLDKIVYVVTGVLAKIPEHFHLDFKYMIPLSSLEIPAERMEGWSWWQFFTYIKVEDDTNIQQLEKNFTEAVIKNAAPDMKESGFSALPFFQPLKDIHLHSADFVYDNAKRGNVSYVKGLTIIAFFVLLIACFNFINLATARSFRRAKEIGVRKVIGADRKQLIFQLIGETVLVSLIAIFIAVIATIVILPYLNNFTGKSISFNLIINPLPGLLLLGIAILIGILSGIYPALVMSGFQPIKVLKGLKPTGNHSGVSVSLRKSLVVLQFALSALLIICTLILNRQINFLHQKDLGFNKEQIIYFNALGGVAENIEVFKEELKRSSGVSSVTAGYGLPGDQLAGDGIIVPGKDGDVRHSVTQLIVDHDYINTIGLQLVSGRAFSKEYVSDVSEAFIINETAVKILGFDTPEAALGQRLHWEKWEQDSLNPLKKGKVIGVVKDFHTKSLHEKLSPTILQIYPKVLVKIAVKINTEDLPNTITHIQNTWQKFSPDYPLEYKFLDENFATMYSAEDKLSTLLFIFTLMAILVGCLGLLGLAAFSAEQRVKEIGIRKVLGASVLSIVSLLSKTFIKPVFIATIIAFPIAWWAMHNWLQDFPYRVEISWWIFVLAIVIAVAIALVTVSFQSIKAATSNPIKSLKTE